VVKSSVIDRLLPPLRSLWSNLIQLPESVRVPVAIAATSLSMTGLMVGIRHLGGLQSFEMVAYDQMVRLRSDLPADPRLLIVAITEADIQSQQRWPLTDKTLATVLQTLQRSHPRVIGLDLYRDLPQEPGHADLMEQLQQPNLIVITKLPDEEEIGVPPPPGVPEDRVGFNDIISDPDGVVRRSLLFADTEDATAYSFGLRVALAYLRAEGITPVAGRQDPTHLQLGQVEFSPLNSTSGAYEAIDAQGYQILLNYRARRHLARQVTLTQVLQGQVDPDWVRDKVVLVGTTARSARDVFLTPYSPAEMQTPKMSGVVIHGQMISQILSGVLDGQPLFWCWSDGLEVLWIAGWAAIAGGIAWTIRHPLGLAISLAIALSALLGSGYALFLHQGWVPLVAPLLAQLLTAAGIVSYRGQQAYRQQQMMMRLLGQNTSPEIASALWKSRDRLLKSGKLPGKRLEATMLFTDIKGFSTLSEQLPPEALLEWLNEYLNVLSEEVRLRQGIINKFTGDGMLAVFGVPVNRTTPIEVADDARHAVDCALAIRARLASLNPLWQQQGLPTIQMRVGIFTGPIVAGSLGGRDRLEYGVIGDSVNIAARLESYDKTRQCDDCRILIACETLIHLQGKVAVEHWGMLELQGKHQKVDVYRVIGYTAVSTGMRDHAKPGNPDNPAFSA